MSVDESGADETILGIKNCERLCLIQLRFDIDYFIALDGDIGMKSWSSSAVKNGAILNDEIKHLAFR